MNEERNIPPGYTEYDGKGMPTEVQGKWVSVRLRGDDGKLEEGGSALGEHWSWEIHNGVWDIIAYKLVGEEL